MRIKAIGWITLFSLFGAASMARAESVVCHVTYGGETRLVEASPSESPYQIAPVAFGSYFLFRIVFRPQPADLAGIKLYTYIDRDSGPVLIHQASYDYPLNTRHATLEGAGFTGQHFVYEPKRDSELQYWCELKGSSEK